MTADMICRLCRGSVPRTHHEARCPLCGRETTFDIDVKADDAVAVGLREAKPTLTEITEWWVWNWRYLVICAVATLGSLVFGFIPGWGGVVAAVCTIIATATGFKAGMKYHKETTR